MTQKMPTRSSTPIRKRDWGTTPVLFSLKNVQPMLVSGPARPEGNVAAPSSFSEANPAMVASGASAFGTEGTETRIKPQAALLKNFSYQNWVASALVVLLILFVIRISVSTESKTPGVANKDSAQEQTAALVAAETKVPSQTATVFNPKSSAETSPAAVPMLTVDPPALSASSTSPSPLLVPDVIPPVASASSGMELANSSMSTPAIPATMNPAPTSPTPFTNGGETSQNSGATLFAAAPTNSSVSHGATAVNPESSSAIPTSPFPSTSAGQGVNFEVGKPQLQLGPADPANGMTGNFGAGQPNAFNGASLPTTNEVAVNIQQTLTPDQPLAAFKELYNEAKRFDGESYGNASYGSLPATPVSTGAANGYQPIYGASSTGAAPMSTTPIGSQTANSQPMGMPQSGTQLSGQAYPPVQQEYRPITLPDPNAAMNNRYQPIRQPATQSAPANGMGTAFPANSGSTASPSTTQVPYVPVGTTPYPAFN